MHQMVEFLKDILNTLTGNGVVYFATCKSNTLAGLNIQEKEKGVRKCLNITLRRPLTCQRTRLCVVMLKCCNV